MIDNEMSDSLGEIRITEEALCSIGAIKTLEVNGVVGMSSNLVDGFSDLLGRKSLSKGVKIIDSQDKKITLNVYVVVRYGYRIPDLALKIQEKVKTSIEEYTNYTVSGVNIYVQGILYEDEILDNDVFRNW